MSNIEILQRFVASDPLPVLCEVLDKGSLFETLEDVMGHFAMFGAIRSAKKIKHIRSDGSIGFVLELYETGGPKGTRWISLTLSRDFAPAEALEAYKIFRTEDAKR